MVGLDCRHAALEAATQRLRPILMTTAAMVSGLVPLLNASGAGAASRFAIGIVIALRAHDRHVLHALCPAVALYIHASNRQKHAARSQEEQAAIDALK